MKIPFFILGLLASSLRAEPPALAQELPAPPPAAQDGFQPLFNGRDLTGWKATGVAGRIWTVVPGANGAVIAARNLPTPRGVEPDLWTEKSYRDFELYADWRLTQPPVRKLRPSFTPDGLYVLDDRGKMVRKPILDAGDSGIYLRGLGRYQVNIWSQPMGSGDINELHRDATIPAEIRRALVPGLNADAPFGQWNRFFITLRGDRVTVVLNGKTVIDHAYLPGIPAEGPLALQHEYGGSTMEFGNLFIKELK